MGYYKNIKCGNCKYSFTGGYSPANGFMDSNLGIPYVKCPKCRIINATGDIPWSQFSSWKKIYHWISLIIRGLLYGFFLGAIIWGVLTKLLEIDFNINIFFPIGIGIIITLSIMIKYNTKTVKKIEKRCMNKDWDYLLSETKNN
ncbi:hypothetical protein LZF95_22820 [Algoriphagus sp. AGSA1]|uniref:hypothetical protein n=1 Tax=Algoriphagus sp. AGSA1 TaxID=2907213 RepID=UPI001F2F0B6A|nr:hypothetical protein [Algoriphagus sp. AGSA1]MCE7057532.1 hypothetical protein [Algoriphagus sp. AGSA1]